VPVTLCNGRVMVAVDCHRVVRSVHYGEKCHCHITPNIRQTPQTSRAIRNARAIINGNSIKRAIVVSFRAAPCGKGLMA
jgi:hypothetical protein